MLYLFQQCYGGFCSETNAYAGHAMMICFAEVERFSAHFPSWLWDPVGKDYYSRATGKPERWLQLYSWESTDKWHTCRSGYESRVC